MKTGILVFFEDGKKSERLVTQITSFAAGILFHMTRRYGDSREWDQKKK